jgi:hypothetical protein
MLAAYTLARQSDRQDACKAIMAAPWNAQVSVDEPQRTKDQNSALHSLVTQVLKQRPHHNGVKMDLRLWKAVFMQAWGAQITMLPTLDGDGFFPLGLSTSKLNKTQASEVIEVILAWCADQGLNIRHFDGSDSPPTRTGVAA